jgi:hypothetical protein
MRRFVKFPALTMITAVFALLAAGAAQARDFEMGGDTDYSIMAPEPGTAGATTHHPTKAPASLSRTHASLLGHEKFVAKLHRGPKMFATRGSSGSVLPTPLPRTGLIGSEGGGILTEPALPQEQGPTTVPGLTRSIPTLPHGPETFQDRASRCAFQSGLYGVPGGARTQYMGTCVQ